MGMSVLLISDEELLAARDALARQVLSPARNTNIYLLSYIVLKLIDDNRALKERIVKLETMLGEGK